MNLDLIASSIQGHHPTRLTEARQFSILIGLNLAGVMPDLHADH